MVLSMDRWVGKVAVVTGASAGIGIIIAEQLVKHGLQVAALARRKDRLEDLQKKLSGQKGKLYPIQADITKEEDILKAFTWIKKNLGPVHILINNAGILTPGNLYDGDTKIWQNTLNLNVIGLSIATREAVKDMKANNVDGHIIHINAVVGHQVINFPGMGIYQASKFAVTALAETLRLELNSQKLKIKITSVSPGAVDTEMVPSSVRENVVFTRYNILQPEDVADAVIYALSTPPHVQIQELTLQAVSNLG